MEDIKKVPVRQAPTSKLSMGVRLTKHFKKYKALWLLAVPGIILTLMFAYIPMSGLVIVFKQYNFKDGIFGSPWVGFDNFKFFFANFEKAWRATKNTMILNVLYTVCGTTFAVALAIMFNEIRNKKVLKVTQSLSILPYFISWVVAGGILRALLSYNGGSINLVLEAIGFDKIDFYNDPKYWRVILTIANIWKGAGYSAIIYFATITGFDTAYYESAEVDGATMWQKIRYITIPLLKPTIIILFLLSVGKMLSGDLTMMMSLTNLSPMLLETTDIIDSFVYRSVVGMGDFTMGSAIGLYQSLFGFVLVLFSNWLAGRFDKEYKLF
ncbi:ABC transporter permease [Clostridium sp. Marseille-P299]|uniref:ABC transporter permease n=1 Tax=Clostridium sp. Marseille-P299 TaxID=1805477 RepID=UPI00082B21C6|nr:ABC transporter permease subunit [Clostridium sp. Marseille-P299]